MVICFTESGRSCFASFSNHLTVGPARRNSTNPSLASAVAQSQAASMTSFFHPSGSVRDGTPLKINALTSVDELLYPYRVNPSQVALLIPPAPALAIFPSRYANGTVSRVHVRSRPFSRIYKQRSRLSVFQSCPSIPVRPVADPRLSTCSDVSSGVLGLVPLYEESGIGSLPLLQRPTISLSRTPDTIASNLPKSRKGKRMAEVISRVVQASPLQTPISKSRLIGRDLLATTNDPSGEEAGHNLEVIEKGKSWMRKSGHVSRGSGNPTPIQPEDSVEIVAARNLQRRRRRRRRRKQSKRKPYEEIISYSPEEQRSNSCDRVQTRQSDQVPSGSNNIADIKNVGVAMDEYYRSKGQKRIDRAGPIWEGPGHPPNISPSIKTITGFPQTSALLRDYRKPLPNSKAWVERI